MAILRMAAGLARRGQCGIWGAVQAYIERQAARVFERERRATLLTVPQTLPPGTLLYDRRADGSVLELRIAVPAQTSSDVKEASVDVTVPGSQAAHLRPSGTDPRQIAAGPQTDCRE
jgi:hypothetical protein